MEYVITTATKKISRMQKRIRAIPGGTSAGKTIGILEYLIAKAQSDKTPHLTSIVSESLPHLKRGAMLDLLSILKEQDYYKDARWNKSDFVYTFETGSKIEFFSADQETRVRGPRRDRLFMNEANNIGFETFEQLEIRTREFVIMDWNPSSEFWYYTELKGKRPDVEELTLTYLDNEALPPTIKASIELRRARAGWWKVYGEGQLGEAEGKIYREWQIIPEVPHEAKLERYVVDFGYSVDPSFVGAIYRYNGGFIVDELAFQKEMSNKQIADVILNQEKKSLVIADAAEPKSIAEIKAFGLTILPCRKGKDSVRFGIAKVQAQRMSVTKASVNVIKEYRNYLWMTDKRTGEILPFPEHEYSHSMDGIRYGIDSLVVDEKKEDLRITEEDKPRYSEIGI